MFGVQNLEIDFERAFFREGSPEQRASMTARVKAVRELGANTLRIYLQLFDFIGRDGDGDLVAYAGPFDNLSFLLDVARREGLYLLVSGNNAWIPREVPTWYDELPHRERWEIQAFFFEHLTRIAASSPAVLAFELMSEPFIQEAADAPWYIGAFGDYFFAQAVARGVPREDAARVAREWLKRLGAVIRRHDSDRLITLGAIGAYHNGALGADNTATLLDFLSPHIYPRQDNPDDADTWVRRWAAVGKPVVVGETHLFRSNEKIFRNFLANSSPLVDGYISFYFGTGAASFGDYIIEQAPQTLALHRRNIEIFRELRGTILEPP
ncbi:MAG: cellulase family glycosylhydrolase [Halioglobus sp.]|nr:cellulase family glycosylhydrolase [Halioglobus sp.]